MKTKPCRDDWTDVMCVCAVYIRCGKDVFIENFCTPPFNSSYVQSGDDDSLYVEKDSKDTYRV